MFHHMGMVVADFERSRALYAGCLAPLGIQCTEQDRDWAIFGPSLGPPFLWLGSARPSFWSAAHQAGQSPIHLAFAAPDRAAVDAFHAAALAHGARDNGAPGPRKSWTTFYSAFVIDLDGNNIEATVQE